MPAERRPVRAAPLRRWVAAAWAVFEKEARLELRSRYALNMLLMFVLASLLLVFFAVGRAPLSVPVQAALLWVVILFAAAVGLGRAFVSEEEGGTVLLLQLNVPGSAVYAGKLLFNYVLVLVLGAVAIAAFVLVQGAAVPRPGLLAATFVLGALGLSGATTFLAAVIARAAGKGPLLPVLLFPILIPFLLSAVSATQTALLGGRWGAATDELLALVGFGGAVVTAAVLLFDYIWQE